MEKIGHTLEELDQDKLWKIYEIALNDLRWASSTVKDFNFNLGTILIKNRKECMGCLLGVCLLRRYKFEDHNNIYLSSVPHEILNKNPNLDKKLDMLGFSLAFGNIRAAYAIFYDSYANYPNEHPYFNSGCAPITRNVDAYLKYAEPILTYLKEKDI